MKRSAYQGLGIVGVALVALACGSPAQDPAVGADGGAGSAGAAGGAGGGASLCNDKSAWACDPMSSVLCGGPGSACDQASKLGFEFQCYTASASLKNTIPIGAPCTPGGSTSCENGGTCWQSPNVCTRYCCTTSDCMGVGTCKDTLPPGQGYGRIGLCL